MYNTTILAVDIGNSNIASSISVNNQWQAIHRIDTHHNHDDSSLYNQFFHSLLKDISGTIHCVIISSVVPKKTSLVLTEITKILPNVLPNTLQCPVFFADIHSKSPLNHTPLEELGQDLFANAVASFSKSNIVLKQSVIGSAKSFPSASLTVDMGTALTFTAVRGNGSIAGVAISPGIDTSYKALVGNAAQIRNSSLTMPDKALGLNTEEALNAGLMLGFRYLIKGMVSQIVAELEEPTKVYATGGLSKLMTSLAPPQDTLFTEINEYHTLDGLKILAEYKLNIRE